MAGVSVALLTVYDMCKALDKSMEIGEIYLCRRPAERAETCVMKSRCRRFRFRKSRQEMGKKSKTDWDAKSSSLVKKEGEI